MVNASIITIGDELLIGQVIDTNSAWMAQELNEAGIAVKRRVAVGDIKEDIIQALNEEGKNSAIILMTGGLGPTADDITKPLLCEYFGGRMIVNEAALNNVNYLFEKVFKRKASNVNLRQAEVPDVCMVIQNERGTAPGMWFEKEGKIFVSMPGVPNEMKGMIPEVIKKLKEKFTLPVIIHKTLVTAGAGESVLAEMITDFESRLPQYVRLAYLPAYGMVRLRLSITGSDRDKTEREISGYFLKLQRQLSKYAIATEDESLECVIGKLLLKQNRTVGTAESCTGGYIAHLITSQPGASAYYKGSVIAYDNSIKHTILNVNNATLNEHGAVSEQSVKEMLSGTFSMLDVDYAVAVSGIMGPGGGTPEKPAGTVWIAVGSRNLIRTQKLQLAFDRSRNTHTTAIIALNALRKLIVSEK